MVDTDSFHETDGNLSSADPLAFADDLPYRDRLRDQQDRTALADAVVTGTATLRGRQIVLAVLDFSFMGGSMGVVVGEKIARAAELALERRRPLVTVVASGGARMQEGMFSLLQMAKTSAAIQRLHRAGVPHLSVLTHPTTGGVLASFGSLGDIIVAEPAALIGFAGPRVVEQILGAPLPPGSHTAEFLLAHGIIDDVVERIRLRSYLGTLLELLGGAHPDADHSKPARTTNVKIKPAADVWETVQAARDPARPTSLDYIGRICDQFVELHGDRESGEDPAIVAGFGSIAGRSVAIVGTERGHGDDVARRRHGRPMPEGYRKAQRIMITAARFHLPILTLVDTPGAYPGIESEQRGLAGEIAETMALMSDLPSPIVAAIIGEGGSGGALALAVADIVVMQANAIYSVIAPEGAAAILYRDAGRAPELAAKLKLTAADCHAAGIVDAVIEEPDESASADPNLAANLLKLALLKALDELDGKPASRLVQERFERYRAYGRSHAVARPRGTRGSATPSVTGTP